MQTLSFSLGLALRNSVVGSNHTREPGDGMELECYVEGVRGMANTSSACQPSWTFSRFGSFLSTTITISYLSALHLCRDDGCVAARSPRRHVEGGPGMANTTRVFSFVFSRLASRLSSVVQPCLLSTYFVILLWTWATVNLFQSFVGSMWWSATIALWYPR